MSKYRALLPGKLTWDPVTGGKAPAICWCDSVSAYLGKDPTGKAFQTISRRMLSGRYYPTSVIEFFGMWIQEGRNMRPGDRILQRIRMFPILPWPILYAMTELFCAEYTDTTCSIGYTTTENHYGRGMWQATLTKDGDELELVVRSTAGPGSWQFWVGLPYARWLMVRARNKAIQDFTSLCEPG